MGASKQQSSGPNNHNNNTAKAWKPTMKPLKTSVLRMLQRQQKHSITMSTCCNYYDSQKSNIKYYTSINVFKDSTCSYNRPETESTLKSGASPPRKIA
jgi:hypothetical protein